MMNLTNMTIVSTHRCQASILVLEMLGFLCHSCATSILITWEDSDHV